MPVLRNILLAVLTATAAAAGAQPAPPDPNTPATTTSPAPVPASAASDSDVAPEQALEDYEASEQISEDLSVAFPVDI